MPKKRNARPAQPKRGKGRGYVGSGPYGGGQRLFLSGSMKEARAGTKMRKRMEKAGKRQRGIDRKTYGGLIGNPIQLLFSTKAAALKYAREHGAKKFSIRKLKSGAR